MLKFSLLFLALLCTTQVWAQELKSKKNLSHIRSNVFSAGKNINRLNSNQLSSFKTQEDPDTVFYDAHVWGQDSICADSIRYYNYIADLGGYVNGTMGPIELQNGSMAIVTEHGVNLRIPPKLENNARVFAVLVAFADNTKIVGNADTYRINVWQASPTQSPQAIPPTFFEEFSGDDFVMFPPQAPDFYAPIFFEDLADNYNKIGNNMLFSLETAKTGADDTLTLYFNGDNQYCDPDELNRWFFRLNNYANGSIGTHLGWIPMNQFLGFPQGTGPNVPLIVPAVIYTPISGVEEGFKMDGLEFMGAYPNPSAHSTTLRYNMDRNGKVTIRVMDMMGRVIKTEDSFQVAAGKHEYNLNLENLSCGITFV